MHCYVISLNFKKKTSSNSKSLPFRILYLLLENVQNSIKSISSRGCRGCNTPNIYWWWNSLVNYLLIQTNIQVNYKTTDLATKCQWKEMSLSVSKSKILFHYWNLRMPLEDCSSAVFSFRHFKNRNLVILWVWNRKFWRARVGGRYKGAIEVILVISTAVDLRGFG